MEYQTRWKAGVDIRGQTVVVLLHSADESVGALVEQALAAAAGVLGDQALVVGPFYVPTLEPPAWYGRAGCYRIERERLARMRDAACRILEEAGCDVDGLHQPLRYAAM